MAHTTSGAPWILFVDHDEPTADALARYLQSRGHRAYAVALGADALSLVGCARPDIAVIDSSLPDMTGMELVARLRALAPRLRVVMTSGDFQPALEIAARRLGIVYYAHKPVDPERLDAVLTRSLVGGTRHDSE